MLYDEERYALSPSEIVERVAELGAPLPKEGVHDLELVRR